MRELKDKGVVTEGPDQAVRSLAMMWALSTEKEGIQRAYETLQYTRQKADKGGKELNPNMAVLGTMIQGFALSL